MWYSASLFFESKHTGPAESSPLWMESVVLFEADSEEAAFEAAERRGREEEHSYKGSNGDIVSWTFVRVERVMPIDKVGPGVEVFSRFLRAEEAQSILRPLD